MSKNILVVDDESAIREALNKVLQAEDYEVVTAENGQEAIEKFQTSKIDLVLLDLGLTVMDGRDTLIWLAQVNPLLPVIVMTGKWNQRELAEKMEVDVLMEKPLDMPRLLQTIRDLIQDPKLWRARHSAAGFEPVPCDNELYVKSVNDRYTTPYKFPEPENH